MRLFAVAKYTEIYYPALEAEVKCLKKLSDAAVKCGDKYARDKKLHACAILINLGWKMENQGMLGKTWKAQLDKLDKTGEGIEKAIEKTCHILVELFAVAYSNNLAFDYGE